MATFLSFSGLTHWPQGVGEIMCLNALTHGDVVVILKCPNTFHRLSSWALVKLASGKYDRTPSVIIQHWFRQCLAAFLLLCSVMKLFSGDIDILNAPLNWLDRKKKFPYRIEDSSNHKTKNTQRAQTSATPILRSINNQAKAPKMEKKIPNPYDDSEKSQNVTNYSIFMSDLCEIHS